MKHILTELLLLLILFSCLTCVEGSAELRKLNILKFGNSASDYIVYQPDMSPLASEFTACAWIRKLGSVLYPNWFSYATSSVGKEIQITDNGNKFYLFGTISDIQSVYNVSPGTWFLNCLSWSSAAQTRNVYINGRVVDAASTPAGRTLGQGGYLMFGNEQDSYGNYRTDADDDNKFEGEMYKLNVFSRMLTTSEIEEMSRNMCANVEEKYGSTRYIKWEDVLQLSRNGNVNEKDSGCLLQIYNNYTSLSSELTEVKIELNRTQAELNTTQKELASTRDSLDGTEERLNETLITLGRSETRLNETEEQLVTSKDAHRETETKLNESLAELDTTKLELTNTQVTLNETIIQKEQGKLELAKAQEALNGTMAKMEEGKLKLLKTQEALNETLIDVETKNDELARTKEKLTATETELNSTLAKVEELEEIANNVPDCALNSTISSQLDFLYSDIFYQHKLTADKLDVVRNILDKLGKS